MSRLLNTGISSLTANQAALQTTGHNIANVNTAGYSRQTVALQTLNPQKTGSGYIGNGVSVATVSRHYSELMTKQSTAALAASAAASARSESLTQMQDIFSGGDSGLGAAINNMLNSFSDLETSPLDASVRTVVLTRISELTARFRSASTSLEEQAYNTKSQMGNNVALVNSLSGQVATLNAQISRSLATGHQPNDLLDKRDELIKQINEHVKTTQIEDKDGSLSLFIAGSQPLVLGSNSASLSLKFSENYPGSETISLYFTQSGGEKLELTHAMAGGGTIAGLMQFHNDDLAEGRNQLGRLVQVIAAEMNAQHTSGLTLNGTQGKSLFDIPISSNGFSNIASYDMDIPSAEVRFTDSVSDLVASDYRLVFGASHPTDTKIVRLSDNTVKSLADPASSTPQDDKLQWSVSNGKLHFQFDGLDFSLDTATAIGSKGESILFQPYSQSASRVNALIHNPEDLAVANAISIDINKSNQGALQLKSVVVSDAFNIPADNAPVEITFNSTGGALNYSVNGTNYVYTSGSPIKVDGWEITLSGTPQAGDSVTVYNALDSSLGDSWKRDAGNASAILALRDKVVFDKGSTLADGFSNSMASIGTRAQSAQYAAELALSVATNLENDRASFSGVNLDEEAARLLQYQQSYQASAKVIQIAQSLFDSVLNTVGR